MVMALKGSRRLRTERRAFSFAVRGLTSGPLRKRANQLTGLAGVQGGEVDGAPEAGGAAAWAGVDAGLAAGFTGQGCGPMDGAAEKRRAFERRAGWYAVPRVVLSPTPLQSTGPPSIKGGLDHTSEREVCRPARQV